MENNNFENQTASAQGFGSNSQSFNNRFAQNTNNTNGNSQNSDRQNQNFQSQNQNKQGNMFGNNLSALLPLLMGGGQNMNPMLLNMMMNGNNPNMNATDPMSMLWNMQRGSSPQFGGNNAFNAGGQNFQNPFNAGGQNFQNPFNAGGGFPPNMNANAQNFSQAQNAENTDSGMKKTQNNLRFSNDEIDVSKFTETP